MFESQAIHPAVLSAAFTAQLAATALQPIVDGFRTRLGALKSIEKSGTAYSLTFAKGTLRASIALDGQGKVSSLVLSDEVSDADTAALQRVLTAQHVSADWFAPSFLAQAPASQLDAGLSHVQAAEGKFVKVDVRDGRYYAVYEKAANPAQIMLDDAGRIDLLYLGAPAAPGG
jgi:hypothetical protein